MQLFTYIIQSKMTFLLGIIHIGHFFIQYRNLCINHIFLHEVLLWK